MPRRPTRSDPCPAPHGYRSPGPTHPRYGGRAGPGAAERGTRPSVDGSPTQRRGWTCSGRGSGALDRAVQVHFQKAPTARSSRLEVPSPTIVGTLQGDRMDRLPEGQRSCSQITAPPARMHKMLRLVMLQPCSLVSTELPTRQRAPLVLSSGLVACLQGSPSSGSVVPAEASTGHQGYRLGCHPHLHPWLPLVCLGWHEGSQYSARLGRPG